MVRSAAAPRVSNHEATEFALDTNDTPAPLFVNPPRA